MYCKCTSNTLYYDISVCQWHILVCVSYIYIDVYHESVFMFVCACACACGLSLVLFQDEKCLLSPHHVNQEKSRDYPASHSLQAPHCWRVSQETQSWQARSGTSAWRDNCGNSCWCCWVHPVTWEGLCRWTAVALACRHLVRSLRWHRMLNSVSVRSVEQVWPKVASFVHICQVPNLSQQYCDNNFTQLGLINSRRLVEPKTPCM